MDAAGYDASAILTTYLATNDAWAPGLADSACDALYSRMVIHMIPEDAQFSDRPGGYIYRRYQRTDDPTLDESFFPLLWSRSAERTTWLDGYCESGRRRSPKRMPA